MLKKYSALLLFLVCMSASFAQQSNKSSFQIVPLGVKGGADESNLSAYMVAIKGSNDYICLDAGTLHAGIEKAIACKVFTIPPEQVLRKHIKAYFISHAHLDHLAGLLINSPDDSTKNIYAFEDCINTFKQHYFTWKTWANFADAGETPTLKKYHYEVLEPGKQIDVPNTTLKVTAYPLSHSNLTSTAFLINHANAYLLYLGDTGPDEVEKSHHLHELWEVIAPLIKNRQLKGIMIETSFPNEQPDKTLFGHFTPKWLMKEFDQLSELTGKDALRRFNVIITHVKPPQDHIEEIKRQLKEENKLGLNLIFPEQGKPIAP